MDETLQSERQGRHEKMISFLASFEYTSNKVGIQRDVKYDDDDENEM